MSMLLDIKDLHVEFPTQGGVLHAVAVLAHHRQLAGKVEERLQSKQGGQRKRNRLQDRDEEITLQGAHLRPPRLNAAHIARGW